MYLTIDLGSTHFKAAVFDRDLALTCSAKADLQYACAEGGVIELKPTVVRNALLKAIAEVLTQPGVSAEEIRAVALTSQAQTFAVCDAGGEPRTNFISWQDARANATADAMKQEPVFADFASQTSFGTILGALMIAIVRHQQRAVSGWLGETQRLVPLPSHLFELLTGTCALDRNLAAMCGFYSMPNASWHAPYLAACGVTEAQLPTLIATGVEAGRTRADNPFGLPAGIPVLFAGNDQTAGAFGADVEKDASVLITLGTAQVAYCTDKTMPEPAEGLIRGPFPGGAWYRLVADGVGGGVVGWAVNALGVDFDAFFRIVGTAPAGCHGVVFDPDLPAERGAWTGIGMHATRGDLARAVIEGLCRRLRGMLDNLGLDWHTRPLRAAGGGSARPEWLAILSETLGTSIEPITADPLLGAARMAALRIR